MDSENKKEYRKNYYESHKEQYKESHLKFIKTHPTYHRDWIKDYRKRKRYERLELAGKCKFCWLLIDSDYHQQYPCKSHLYANRVSSGTLAIQCV